MTMVARNFYEIDNNIFYPRLDVGGELTGITGMEFPLLNYLMYLVSLVFGYSDWFGRPIVLITTSVGILYFHKFIHDIFDKKTALYSTIILLCSLWYTYSRKTMPDTFSGSIVMIGVFYGYQYFKKDQIKHLFLFSLFTCLGLLARLPFFVISSSLIYFYFQKEVKHKTRLYFTIVSALTLFPVLLWYYYWVPFLTTEFGYWHFFMGKPIMEGLQDLIAEFGKVCHKFYEASLGISGFVVFITSFGYAIVKKQWKIVIIFSVSFLSMFMVMLKSGWGFANHDYYILPLVPAMALVVGWGINEIKLSKLKLALLLILLTEGIGRQFQGFMITSEFAVLEQIEAELDKTISDKDLIAFNSGYFPTPMYFAHRKGWVHFNEYLNKEGIDELRSKGCKKIIILKKLWEKEFRLPLPIDSETENWIIYDNRY